MFCVDVCIMVCFFCILFRVGICVWDYVWVCFLNIFFFFIGVALFGLIVWIFLVVSICVCNLLHGVLCCYEIILLPGTFS